MNEDPIRVSICHCFDCQRRTGSVFGAQARFRKDAVQVSGSSTQYVRVGDEGGKATFNLRPRCGAIVHFQVQGHEETVAIPVGAFAEPGFPAPTVSVWEEDKHPWVIPARGHGTPGVVSDMARNQGALERTPLAGDARSASSIHPDQLAAFSLFR